MSDSECVKQYYVFTDVDKIYQLFLDNSFSTHTYKFGKEKLGFRDLKINFNHLNNYYSNIQIDKLNNITVNIGIPTNGKEKRVKENISFRKEQSIK